MVALYTATTAHMGPSHAVAPHSMPLIHQQSASMSGVSQLRSLRFAREENTLAQHAAAGAIDDFNDTKHMRHTVPH